jgi:uncharacterized protein
VLVFEVNDGEMMESFTQQAKKHGVTNGAIVSLIGGVDRFVMSTMPASDASRDLVSEYEMPAEMHGAGEIKDGTVHVHATMAVQGDRAVAGHLHKAMIGTWFARAYVIPC